MRAVPFLALIYTDIPHIDQPMHIMTIEGYAYYDVTFSARTCTTKLKIFLKDGLTKCAVVLPPTDVFLKARVEILIPTEA